MNISSPTRRHLLATGAAFLFAGHALAQVASQVASTSVASAPSAGPVVVQMLNRATDDPKATMVFEPAVVWINKGDTVRFEPTNPGHNVDSIKGMLPEGAEGFKTAIGKGGDVVFAEEGVYGYGCTPHLSMGMVGLVMVGDPSSNWEEAKAVKMRGKITTERMAALFEQAQAMVNGRDGGDEAGSDTDGGDES